MILRLQSLAVAGAMAADSTSFIRFNQVGYLTESPKVAVVCTLGHGRPVRFTVREESGRVVLSERGRKMDGAFGPCADTQRLDFSEIRRDGRYLIEASGAKPVTVRIGGLVDGPVNRSIFGSLRGIALRSEDEYARFNTGFIVYHDDIGDYSTNEPIMDGTASLVYLLSALDDRRGR